MSTDTLGPPIAYLALKEGAAVYDRGGERVGVVEHVLADETHDIFEGVILHTLPLPGRHLFADVAQIAELRERGVRLSVDRDELREPSENPATPTAHPDDTIESPFQARLRRAWDWLSER